VRYISVFSGIEAATVAWKDFGWTPVAFADIDEFPSAVLEYHYPTVSNLGDVVDVEWEQYKEKVDLIVGGSPCQSFSQAGKRLGLDDPRGNLALHYLRVVRAVQPKWFIYENVPGLLSSNGGDDFAAFLGEVAKCGYGFAYRILDAQYFGVPQRRRRIFVVGCANGDWRSAAAVLFDKESLCGNSYKSKKKRQGSSLFPQASVGKEGGELGRRGIVHCSPVAPTMMASGPPYSRTGQTTEDEALVVQKKGMSIPIHDKATRFKGGGKDRKNDGASNFFGVGSETDPMYALTTNDQHMVFKEGEHVVRRLTPIECERLQGFPDNYTQIAWKGKPVEECPLSHRYKALGNSMAVPVMRWIGERIKLLDSIDLSKRENPKTTKQMKLW
jgi:DNA (cytosine-5)-methyltransferase 1